MLYGYGKIILIGNVNLSVENNTWTFTRTNSGLFYNYILVQYPKTQNSFKPTVTVDITAIDEDSHLEEDGDHNDLASGTATMKEIEWVDYEYIIGTLEDWDKYGQDKYPE